MRCTAIVLAAGQGKRMNSKVQKQFLCIQGHPVVYYSLQCFESCSWITDIVLVTGKDEIDYCKEQIVEKYNFQKVSAIVAGGKERYNSVYHGLMACSQTDYVFIHDGARPFVTQEILERGFVCVQEKRACAAGMPSKDTIKIVNANRVVEATPDRRFVWNVQTPQVFEYALVTSSYTKALMGDCSKITDDAMVVETYGNCEVVLYEGSYENVKITTPSDLILAEEFVKHLF